MKKFLLSAFIVISFSIYSLFQRGNPSITTTNLSPTSTDTGGVGSSKSDALVKDEEDNTPASGLKDGELVWFSGNPTIYFVVSGSLYPFATYSGFLDFTKNNQQAVVLLPGSASDYKVSPILAESQKGLNSFLASAAPATKPKGQYVDGSYTGITADAYYGPMQVKVTIKGGKISDVVFLAYPNDRPTSLQINGEAMPVLEEEAITIQSAEVDIVTGATQSSVGFRETLASALSQAES